MALADIINRIEADAAAEALVITQAAEESAAKVIAGAVATAASESASRIERAEREAEAEAQTVRANARLLARDTALAEKRRLIDDTLAAVADAVVGLPDAAYAELLGKRIAEGARGGETVYVAAADAMRLSAALPAAVKAVAPELELTFASDPAPGIEHGALLLADRIREDFSVDALVHERREDLSMLVSGILFAGGED